MQIKIDFNKNNILQFYFMIIYGYIISWVVNGIIATLIIFNTRVNF
jgi:hypothetical protein